MTHDVKDRTAAVGDWFPPGFVEAVGHTLLVLRGIFAVGILILGALVWIGYELRRQSAQEREDAKHLTDVVQNK